jgi:hydroxymethylbilane synthase
MSLTAPLRIGTRGSRLALWQAGAVRDALIAAHGLRPNEVEIVPITTSGDRIRDRSLSEAGGKGLFTKEIETALLSGAVSIAVHSAKDMETALPPGLAIGAILRREDVRDALVARDVSSVEALPKGARVGTASLRRAALMRRARPDIEIGLLRGNVPTRIRRIEEGAFDATLLAVAGLKRLGLEGHIRTLLPIEKFPPACGQGAIAIECREGDGAVRDLLAAIDHGETAAALSCERAFLATLDGSCQTPVGGHASIKDGSLAFDGILLSEDGTEFYEAHPSGDPADAEAIGRDAAHEILSRAPPAFLKRLGIGGGGSRLTQ